MNATTGYALSGLFVLLMSIGLPILEYQQKQTDRHNQENVRIVYK